MTLFLRCYCLLLALSTCLILTVQEECSKDCTACAGRLAYHADINPLACTLECEGKLPSAKAWETCKELLQLTKLELPQEGNAAVGSNAKEQEDIHLLSKKYGGFMKRYGGFMKKMDELYHIDPEEEVNGGETLAKRYGGFMKKDSNDDALANSSDLLKELLGATENAETGHYRDLNDEGEVIKRYGGFMRSIKRSPEMEEEAKELQKRYGGFMRRVGRPEWWLDYQKRYGGFLKRFADSLLPSDEDGESYSKEVPEMEKRYGGFMRF
uniref:Proenkephalin n=1 Tax=Salvator merianae TaxID=96440 RepID=A0A8D0DUS4_SALMN